MPTSPYFQRSNQFNEQRLMEDLFVEVIKNFGTDAFYLPRNSQQTDLIYGEDPMKSFTTNYPIEVYNVDVNDFEGQREVFSKFGIELKIEYTVIMSRKSFLQRVNFNPAYQRPIEGDLLWIPHVRGKGILYEITFVNPEANFFILNKSLPYYYSLKLEPFKYSQEIIQVGQPGADQISMQDAYTISFTMASANSFGDYIVTEVVYQGTSLPAATAEAYVSFWDQPSLTLNVTNITGVFSTNANVIGSISGASYELVSYNTLQDNLTREVYDNLETQTEGLSYINLSENNPLGNPD